jgi:hypothetical protein
MKKIFFSGIFLVLLIIVSCSKDEYTEKDATDAQKDLIAYQDSINQIRDSLNHLGGIIQYSVSVVPVNGNGSFLKSGQSAQGLSGAVVTVAQHGIVKTDTAGSSGICVFNDLRVGTVSVNVRAADYTSVDFIAEILPEDNATVNMYYNVLRYAATMVPVFSLTEGTSTISGQLTYESNLTNLTPEPAAGIKVIAIIDVDDSGFITNYFKQLSGSDLAKYNAEIVQIAFTDLIASSTTDASGNYSIEMPSTSDGLPIKLEVDDIAVDQQLLMNTVNGAKVNGIQTIRTIFSSNLTTGTASAVPSVPAAYVTFDAPLGSVAQQPDKAATASAVIAENGIASITISNQGNGYTQAPLIKITGDGEGAEAVAYISDGKVTSIQITNPGSGYTYANVSAVDKEGTNATLVPTFTYSITSYYLDDNGSGYKSVPQVTVTASTGSGATAKAIMSGYIDKIEVTNQGNDYTCPPNVIISGSTGNDASAYADMTNYNPIHSIELTDNFTTLYKEAPVVQIIPVSTGSGATAVATLATVGSVGEIQIDNAGLGYTQAPTVLIVGGGGHGAVAYSTLNADGSININIAEEGVGYTSDPTIQISAPPTGGTQAAATAIRYFEIEKLTMTNPGSGYDISFSDGGWPDEYNNEPNVVIDGSYLSDNQVIVRPNMKVENVYLNSAGSDYQTAPTITFVPSCGSGSGATATSTILYYVEKVEVVAEGSGYTFDSEILVTIVTPTEGCSQQAIAYANLSKGVLSSLEITEDGEGYIAPPNVVIESEAGSPTRAAKVTSQVSDGKVTGYTIVDAGEGYPYSNPGNFDAIVKTHTVVASLAATAYPESGKISFVTISDPGYGYSTVPLVRFVRKAADGTTTIISHDFVDAEATAVLTDGRVTAIEISNPGTGYYYRPSVEIYIPSYSQTAIGTPNIDALGHITGVTFTDNGMGYTEVPAVTFYPSVPGMGTGATGVAIVSNGQITGVKMTNMGNGYLGKNYPTSVKGVSFVPSGSALTTFSVYASKTYIRDIYLGTGKRLIEQ